MQTAEKQVLSLRLLDGGLGDPAIGCRAGLSAAGDSDLAEALAALGRLLGTAERRVRLATAPVCEGPGFDAWLTAAGVPTFVTAPLSLRRVRAFSPALKARDRTLDVVIVSPVARARDTLGDAIDGDTFAAACTLARRLGRERIVVAGERRVDSELNEIAAGDIGVAWSDVAELAGTISAAGGDALDVIVTSETAAPILAAVAAGVAGSAALATHHVITDDGMASTAGAASTDALPSFAGLALAASELLALTGHAESAARIADAWCRAVEDGVHTADFAVTHPYARIVCDMDFAAAVIERLGQQPRTISRHLERFTPRSTSAERRARMRVVRD